MAQLYFIEADTIIRGKRASYFPERDPDDMSRKVTISDIAAGQVENVRRVYCADIEARTFIDVSEEIAQEIANGLDQPPSYQLKEFLEEHLGCGAVAQIEHEMEAA